MIYVRPLLPTLLLSVLGCAITAAISSCYPTMPPAEREKPLLTQGLPTVRIKLTGSPVNNISLTATAGHSLLCDGKMLSQSAGRLLPLNVFRSGGSVGPP